MPHTLIASNPTDPRFIAAPGAGVLKVAEFFSDTVQGEGVSAGVPSTFLRLQGCTLDCVWCDSNEVWRYGNPYTFNNLLDLIESVSLHERFKLGQRLILTGGSPLKQQYALIGFLEAFQKRFGYLPFVEVENEAVLMPSKDLTRLVSQWNNSPKLANSNMKLRARFKPDILHYMSSLPNSWFKFVVSEESDWDEIESTFLKVGIIRREQVILMPCGEDQKALSGTRELAAEMAVKHNVRFTDRLHVTIWNKKTGV